MTQDKDYIVLKLITGETVMAIFQGEDERFIKVDYPVQIKTNYISGVNREAVTAAPFCQFSDSTAFILEKTHVLYIKRLHHAFVRHYKNFVKVYDEALVPLQRSEEVRQELEEAFDDMDEISIEEVNRRLDILEAIANSPSSEKDEEEEFELINFVPGNDTKH